MRRISCLLGQQSLAKGCQVAAEGREVLSMGSLGELRAMRGHSIRSQILSPT